MRPRWAYIAWPGTGFLSILAGAPPVEVEPSPFDDVGDGERVPWLGVSGRGTIGPWCIGPFGAGGLEGRRGPCDVPGREPWGGGPWGRGLTGSFERQVRGATPCWLRSILMQRAYDY